MVCAMFRLPLQYLKRSTAWCVQCSGCPYNTLRGALVCAVFLLPLQYLKRSTAWCVQCSDCPYNTLRGALHGVCSVQVAPRIP